jgi:hypothetical protein
LIAEGQKNGTIETPGGNRKSLSATATLIPDTRPIAKSLPSLGISRDQSSQWQQLAGLARQPHPRLSKQTHTAPVRFENPESRLSGLTVPGLGL